MKIAPYLDSIEPAFFTLFFFTGTCFLSHLEDEICGGTRWKRRGEARRGFYKVFSPGYGYRCIANNPSANVPGVFRKDKVSASF